MTTDSKNARDKRFNVAEDFGELDPLRETIQVKHEKQKRSFKETCCFVIKNTTVEPTMFFFILSVIITVLTSQNLNLEKACRVNLNFTSQICDSLKSQTLGEQNEYERDVQNLVAKAMSWRTYITASLPCIIALFVGSWSDRTGYRKIFLIIAISGQMLSCLNGIINTFFFHQLKLEVFVFTDAFIDSLSGSWCVFVLTLFAYISAITTNENRTFRMGLINFSLTVGFPIGMSLSGILLKTVGYYGCYGFSLSLHFINIIYNIFILQDPQRTSVQNMNDNKSICSLINLFFDLTNVKDTFQVVFKRGPKNRRLRICVMLVVVSILFGPMHGELSILYISTRYRFNWDEIKFSIFQTYNFVTHTVGTIFSITVFSKYLQWHDSILGIISTISKIAASFVYCFATNERIFFIGIKIYGTIMTKSIQIILIVYAIMSIFIKLKHFIVIGIQHKFGILKAAVMSLGYMLNNNGPNEILDETGINYAPLVDILNGTSLLAMRSILSKSVLPEELGKVNSIFALTENLMPLVYVPLYTSVYIATMEVLPGAVFLMGSAMTIPAVIIFIGLLVEHKKNISHANEQTNLELTSEEQ